MSNTEATAQVEHSRGQLEKEALEKELFEILDEYENVIKPFYERKEAFLQRWATFLGESHKVQHPETTKVYHVIRPKGRYVPFPEYDIEKMIDKEAKALGFDVKPQPRNPSTE